MPGKKGMLDNGAIACFSKFAQRRARKQSKDFYREGAKAAKKMDCLQIVAENVTKWYET